MTRGRRRWALGMATRGRKGAKWRRRGMMVLLVALTTRSGEANKEAADATKTAAR